MQTLIPKKEPSHRFPRKWLLLSALVAASIGIVLIFFRPEPDEAHSTEQGSNATLRAKPGYRNRTMWRAPATAGAQPHETPPIRGTIYDMDGTTIAGATVFATTFESAGNVATKAGTTASDKDGRFELRLSNGSYYVHADKDGYGASLFIAQSGDDIALVLPTSGVIEGHVYDEQGDPVPHFTIDVITVAPPDMAAPPPLWSKRFDNADGSFRVDRLPPWGAMLRASAPSYAPAFSSMLSLEPGQRQEVNLTLPRGCPMVGSVVDDEGTPLPDVLVNAETRKATGMMSDLSVAAGGEALTDASGQFRLANVPQGDVVVRGYDGRHAVTSLIVPVSDCDSLQPVELRMSAGGSVVGVVRGSDGVPLAGAKLTMSHRSIGFVNTMSDALGRYHFDELPPAVVRIEVQQGQRRTATHVAVQEGEVVQKDIALFGDGSGELRGRITAGGIPLAGAQVLVATNRGPQGMDLFYPRTGADGTYRLTALADGAYMVIVSSTNRVGSVRVRDGSVETVDLDVAERPERLAAPAPPPPQPGAPQ